nr:glycosyltransferase family 2 protein [Roseomonas acroporae]
MVIPAYQEAASIAEVVRRARAAVPGAPVLVVDDGSTDGTAALAAAAGATVLDAAGPGTAGPGTAGLGAGASGAGVSGAGEGGVPATGRNRGKGVALRRGMRHALALGAARVVTLDGDGQHRPEDIPALLRRAEARPGAIVIGSRRAQASRPGNAVPAARRRANRVADFWISWAAGHAIADTQSGLRVYPAAALRELGRYGDGVPGFVFESAILIDAARRGHRTEAVEIEALYGDALRRPSHFRPVADVTRIVLMVAGRLLARGMAPTGLWRSLAERRRARR